MTRRDDEYDFGPITDLESTRRMLENANINFDVDYEEEDTTSVTTEYGVKFIFDTWGNLESMESV